MRFTLPNGSGCQPNGNVGRTFLSAIVWQTGMSAPLPYDARVRTSGATPMATATAPSTGTYRQLYVDGQWTDATGGKRLSVINPATEDSIGEAALRQREEC